jgi:hypothetical protein
MKKQTRCPVCGQSIYPPKTTGARSQNSAVHGYCKSLAEQIPDNYTPDEVKLMMKFIAVDAGVYPARTVFVRGEKEGKLYEVPKSLSLANTAEVNALIKVIQEFADRNNYWLWKYTFDGLYVYKSIGGRSGEEMERDFPDFNTCMTSAFKKGRKK